MMLMGMRTHAVCSPDDPDAGASAAKAAATAAMLEATSPGAYCNSYSWKVPLVCMIISAESELLREKLKQ